MGGEADMARAAWGSLGEGRDNEDRIRKKGRKGREEEGDCLRFPLASEVGGARRVIMLSYLLSTMSCI